MSALLTQPKHLRNKTDYFHPFVQILNKIFLQNNEI